MSMEWKLAYGNKEDIDSVIADSTLDAGDLVITKDTNELVFIKEDNTKAFIKDRSSKEYTLNGTDLGALKDGDSIPEGTSIDELLNMITQKAIAPTYTSPSVSIARSGSGTSSGNYEAGTSIEPIITATFNKNQSRFNTDVQFNNNLLLQDIIEYKAVRGENNQLIGYDLYVQE